MTVMMLLSVWSGVSAQSVAVVGSRKQVNPDEVSWREPSVAVACFSAHDEVVVAAKRLSDSHISYGVSLAGASSFSNGVLSWPNAGDTVVAVDPLTDRLWITALSTNINLNDNISTMSIWGSWKEPSEEQFNQNDNYVLFGPYAAMPQPLDRPTLRVLSNGNYSGQPLLTFLYNHDDDVANCGLSAWAAIPDASPYENKDVWTGYRMEPDPDTYPEVCMWQGWGATPVELSDGRVVVVVHDYLGQYNDGLPYVVYSDDGGQTWLPNALTPVQVAPDAGIVPATYSGGSPPWSDTPFAIDRRKCAPAIAVDPGSDEVYVAFYARKQRNDHTTSDRNSDIYISRSTDEGESFPSNDVLQLTDELLGLEPDAIGPDQVMPSIAVDPCGGVNLVFYDNRNDENRNDNVDEYDVYFARITDFGTENMAIQQVQLTTHPFELPSGGAFLGDYHHMAFAGPGGGPTLYPAWIGMHGHDPAYQYCYINKIAILCWTELSSYIAEQEDSCELFERLYKEGRIAGDLNGDEVVDSEDEAIFAKLIEEFRE